MTRKFCDRCDAQADTLTTLNIPVDVDIVSGKVKAIELCGRCLYALKEWVKPLPKVMAK